MSVAMTGLMILAIDMSFTDYSLSNFSIPSGKAN